MFKNTVSLVEEIHPLSLKSLKSGHPWITKDKYSLKFPHDADFIQVPIQGTLKTFINDPSHPDIKARYWSDEFHDFEMVLNQRICEAVLKRSKVSQLNSRENYYLIFGQADQLPALFIQKLGEVILIQYTSQFWENRLTSVVAHLRTVETFSSVYTQSRVKGLEKNRPKFVEGKEIDSFQVNEFGINYLIKFNLNHDVGLYTDMAASRSKLIPLIKKSDKVLNLFSYTGSFSLLSLKSGAQVTSVDSSKVYMNWLEENISINELDASRHQSVVQNCHKFLDSNSTKFDLIICDPPSSFTQGKKRVNSFHFYKEYLKNLNHLLSTNGILVCFLNTHSINRRKFTNLFHEEVNYKNFEPVKINLGLTEDCSLIKGFQEGNYLKSFILRKIN